MVQAVPLEEVIVKLELFESNPAAKNWVPVQTIVRNELGYLVPSGQPASPETIHNSHDRTPQPERTNAPEINPNRVIIEMIDFLRRFI